MRYLIQIKEQVERSSLFFRITPEIQRLFRNEKILIKTYILQGKNNNTTDFEKENTNTCLIPFPQQMNDSLNREDFFVKYCAGIARFILANWDRSQTIILIISNPFLLLIAQYLKTKINVKLILLANKYPTFYFNEDFFNQTEEIPFKGNLQSNSSLIDLVYKAYILADRVVYYNSFVKRFLEDNVLLTRKQLVPLSKIAVKQTNNRIEEPNIQFFQILYEEKTTSDYYRWKNNQFRKNGKETLFIIKEVLDKHSVSYWLDYGTLLGAIREDNLINHDSDIDIAIFYNDFTIEIEKDLTKRGFVKKKQYKLEFSGRIVEQTYEYRNVNIDLFFYLKHSDTITGYSFYAHTSFEKAMKTLGGLYTIETKFKFEGIDKYSFLGTYFNVPKDPISYLKQHYGTNYFIPDPNWNYVTDPLNSKTINERGLLETFD